jgi:hypothetical protein
LEIPNYIFTGLKKLLTPQLSLFWIVFTLLIGREDANYVSLKTF